jgi:hypothetical protein
MTEPTNEDNINLMPRNTKDIELFVLDLHSDAKCGLGSGGVQSCEGGCDRGGLRTCARNLRDDDVFFEHSRWKLTEPGRSASTDTLRSIILQDPPLEIALWDAMFEARDVGDNCWGCEPDDPLLSEHRRLLAHLLDRVERIRAAGHI